MSPRSRHVGAGALRRAPVGLERPPLTRLLWRLRHRSRRGCGIHESVIALSAFSDCVYTVRCTRDTRLLCVRLRNGQSCGVRREAVVSFPRRRQSSGLRAKRPSIAFQLVIPAEREDSPDVRRRTVRCDWGVPKVCSFRSSGREGGRTKKLFGGRSSCWPGAVWRGSAAAQGAAAAAVG